MTLVSFSIPLERDAKEGCDRLWTEMVDVADWPYMLLSWG